MGWLRSYAATMGERFRGQLIFDIDIEPGSRQKLVRETDRAFFLDVDDIQRVSASGNNVEVYAGGKVHLVRDSLTSFVAQLDPAEFLRVHRSHVIRVGFILSCAPDVSR